ncbi:DUF4328 domain-containing protein [Kitasatospora sp. NPDC056446]|uniref:DUF4328 domain-containing protein n=1 Tax=Kitasatospora sp. NPDC056446 TaxID=3345819 RepID=UPI0036C92666
MDHSQQDRTSAGADRAGGQQFRALSGLGVAASVLIVLTLVYDVLLTVSDWRVYLAVEHFLAGTATEEEIQAADDFSGFFTTWKGLAVFVVGGLAFLTWLWRARINAESLGGPGSQRRARGWTVGAWITPVANLWIPYRIVTDIWKASAPGRSAPGPLLAVWWGAWVVGGMVGRSYTYLVMKDSLTEDDLRRAVYLATVSTAFDVLAGVLVLYTVSRISGWQTQRRAEVHR